MLGLKMSGNVSGGYPSSCHPWLNPSDPIDIDFVTFKAITFHRPRWSPHHLLWADSWLATNYWPERAPSAPRPVGVSGGLPRSQGLLSSLLVAGQQPLRSGCSSVSLPMVMKSRWDTWAQWTSSVHCLRRAAASGQGRGDVPVLFVLEQHGKASGYRAT